MHPYSTMPDSCFWKKAVAGQPIGLVDPMINQARFKINSNLKVATMGSCFAQHVSRLIEDLGLNFLITDSHLGNINDGIGVFSARYGNVYTVRQAIQLLDLLESDVIFEQEIWEHRGRLVDSMRPNAVPKGFNTIQEIQDDRKSLQDAVLKMLDQMDVFIYTLGLTEGWVSTQSGQIFPIAPGVAGGEFNSSEHSRFNDDFIAVRDQLITFINKVRERNSNCQIILTVSPVPLAATHGSQHVLVANQYSKSVLRVVAQEICGIFNNVYYFPSYEIVAGLAQPEKYFQSNLRDIYPRGINHAMRIFKRHFIDDDNLLSEYSSSDINVPSEDSNASVLCDENLIYNLKNEN